MIRSIWATTFCAILFGMLCLSAASGQQSRSQLPTTGPWDSAEQMRKGQEREALNSIQKGPDGTALEWRGVDYSRYGSINFGMTQLLIEEQEKLLRPTPADRAGHAQFLKQPHAGLVRLMPAKSDKVVSVAGLGKKRTTVYKIPGGGAYYSFTKLNHAPDMWADLKLIDGAFEVAFGADVLGALTALGDVPLDTLTIDNPALTTLAKYTPPSKIEQAKIEHERFKSGFVFDKHLFKATFRVQENMTYALRSIAYQRSDVLVALRVLRQDSDGSVLLLWKRMEKFPTPKLKGKTK